MKKIKYFAIIAASIFTLTSCTDIVEVDDLKAKENKPQRYKGIHRLRLPISI